MEYTLKDKLTITEEFLKDLETRSWQEIEHLQAQIANIEANEENKELIKLLKNLLTSYYVFTGGLENLGDEKTSYKVANFSDKVCADKEIVTVNAAQPKVEPEQKESDDFLVTDVFEPFATEHPFVAEQPAMLPAETVEPFEYFVDFDDPVGEPISDDDLYGN